MSEMQYDPYGPTRELGFLTLEEAAMLADLSNDENGEITPDYFQITEQLSGEVEGVQVTSQEGSITSSVIYPKILSA